MINIVLRGGCANQMFQFATGYALSRKFNTGIILDITNYKTDQMREYNLDLFGGIRNKYDKVYDSIVDIHERGLPYDPELLEQITKDSCIKGYWQCEKYFKQYANELFKIFTPFFPLTATGRDTYREIIQAGNRSVFLTIRRTDYVNSDFHGLLPKSYYDEALKVISKRANIDLHVFIFSDEPDWVNENFQIPYQTTLAGTWDRTVKGHLGREDEDLFLMRSCQHSICANSSFSWMGAWMADHNPLIRGERIVVAPLNWFGSNCPEDSRDIVPDRWIKL